MNSSTGPADEIVMRERRQDDRLFCADLVEMRWFEAGKELRKIANLEDISHSGICLLAETSLPPGKEVIVKCGSEDLHGSVRHCTEGEAGFVLGIELEPHNRWSAATYCPRHLLDPADVLAAEPLPETHLKETA